MNGADRLSGLEEFLTTYSERIPALFFLGNLVLAAVLAYVLGYIYARFGTALSNRRRLAGNFMMLAMTTMLIITIVKSSLALSLGLVGALSIVRFRAAIKEPEELMYLFLCIAIGLGLGANQTLITVMGFAIISLVICGKSLRRAKDENRNMQLTLSSGSPDRIGLEKIVATLSSYCTTVALRRLDETEQALEASLVVEFPNVTQLEACMSEFRSLDRTMTFSFLDTQSF